MMDTLIKVPLPATHAFHEVVLKSQSYAEGLDLLPFTLAR
jgi:hypothetical protein